MSGYVISYAIGPRKRPGMGFAYGSHRTLSTTAFQSVAEARRAIGCRAGLSVFDVPLSAPFERVATIKSGRTVFIEDQDIGACVWEAGQ